MSRIFIEEESADYEKSLEQNGHRYLNYVAELAAKKGVQVEMILRRGAISTEIVEVAEDNDAGLILLGGFEDRRPAGRAQPPAPRDHEERALLHPGGEGARHGRDFPEAVARGRGPRVAWRSCRANA